MPSVLRRMKKVDLFKNKKNKKKNKKGVPIKVLKKNTLPKIKINAKTVKILTKKVSTTSKGLTELMCKMKDQKPDASGKSHFLSVVRLIPDTDRVWVSCDCEWFTFYCEYALAQHGASDIIYSNGQPAVITNPNNTPMCCKHLFSLLNKRRMISLLKGNG